MKKIDGSTPNPTLFSLDAKLRILKEIRKKLKIFKNHGVMYFDIRIPNFKIQIQEGIEVPVFLDMDNIQTDEDELDVIPTDLKKYILHGGKLDTHGQIGMFNIFTLEFLASSAYKVDKDADKILKAQEYLEPDSAFDHEYLMDYVK